MHIEIIFASAGVDVERLHSRGYGVIGSNVGGGDLLLALMGYGWKGRLVILCYFCKKKGF